MPEQSDTLHTESANTVQQVVASLRRIIRAIDLHSKYLATHYGLTGPQLVILQELKHNDQIPIRQITKAVHLSHATVTGILDRLEKRGLVKRQRDQKDKRIVRIYLTESAHTVLKNAPSPLQESFQNEFTKLADWEQTLILSSVQRLVSMMEAKHIKATPILTTGPIDEGTEEMEHLFPQDNRTNK